MNHRYANVKSLDVSLSDARMEGRDLQSRDEGEGARHPVCVMTRPSVILFTSIDFSLSS